VKKGRALPGCGVPWMPPKLQHASAFYLSPWKSQWNAMDTYCVICIPNSITISTCIFGILIPLFCFCGATSCHGSPLDLAAQDAAVRDVSFVCVKPLGKELVNETKLTNMRWNLGSLGHDLSRFWLL
jgi:hypothetical protein